MNQRSDIDRLLRHWMDDGPTRMPDRIVDVVADRISVQRQRRSWRLPWRLPMNSFVKLGAAVAAVLVVAVVGWNLLPKSSGPGGDPTPTPIPTPIPTPTGTPVATGPVDLPDGAVVPGRYRMTLFEDASSPSVVADVPAGWQGIGGNALVSPGEDTTTGIVIALIEADGLFSDPCQWVDGRVVVGPTVDDLVTALKANTSYPSSAATPVTFGKFEGQELELQLPGDDVLSTCDRASPNTPPLYYVFSGGGPYAQGPNSRWHLYIVDVDGTRLITLVSIAEGTPDADVAAAMTIVESFEFTP
jgi:hypothetical protein